MRNMYSKTLCSSFLSALGVPVIFHEFFSLTLLRGHSSVPCSAHADSSAKMSSHVLCLFPNPSVTRTREICEGGPVPREASHKRWKACERSTGAWCRLPSGCIHSSHAVLGNDSLIVTFSVPTGALLIRAGQGFLQAFLLPLPRIEVRWVTHVVVYKRVLDRVLFTLAVCGLEYQITVKKILLLIFN